METVEKLTHEFMKQLSDETANFMDKYRLKNQVMLLATQHAILIHTATVTKLLSSMKNDKITRLDYINTVMKGINDLFNAIKSEIHDE